MGATNHTTNYELSQFIGTDKPSWLNDYNNDMLKIDTAVKANATAASGAQSTANTADGKADANALAIQTLDSQINTPSTGLAAVVAGHTTSIGTINGTIGTTPLTTVAQTLTGAIEEVKGSIPSTTNVLKYLGQHTISVAYDGVKTVSQVMDECYAAFATYISTLTNPFFKFVTVTPRDSHYTGLTIFSPGFRTSTPARITSSDCYFNISGIQGNTTVFVTSGSTAVICVNGTVTDISTEIYDSGAATIQIELYATM